MMISSRNQIIGLIEQGKIPVENIGDALDAVKVTPDAKAWRNFIDNLMFWLGGLALAFAVMFFIAYNWNEIGRFAKFGMVEALVVLAITVYWKLGENKVAGKVSLLMATIFLGVLLALYGQTYQTGADPWQLFFNWSLLMLPWAIIGRFPAIWAVWVVLINLSIVLYHQAMWGVFGFMFRSDTGMLWILFFFNSLALIAWEALSQRWHWLSERWAIRLLAVGGGLPITWLTLYAVFHHRAGYIFSWSMWAVWLALLYLFYRKTRPDLFMLAAGCLSGIVVLVTFLARHLLDDWHSGGFLFLAMVVIGLGTGAAVWLRNVHKEWQP